MASRRPDTQEEFGWWLQELEHSDALSNTALANRYQTIRAQTNKEKGLSRRLMQIEAMEHIMFLRFFYLFKKEAGPHEGRPKARKLLR